MKSPSTTSAPQITRDLLKDILRELLAEDTGPAALSRTTDPAPPPTGDTPTEPPKCRRWKKLPKVLTADQEAQLVRYARDQLVRDTAGPKRGRPVATKIFAAKTDLFAVLFDLGTGLRVAELCDLKIEEVDLQSQQVFVNQGKGGKDRIVPLSDALVPVVTAWIGTRRKGYLIPRADGRRFSAETMYWRIRRLGARAKIPFQIKVHTLRHAFATRLYEQTRDLRVVQVCLGHESISTTQIYAHCSTKLQQDAVNQMATARRDLERSLTT